MREIIPYVDEATWLRERAKDLTSTDIAALFGVSPYCTAFELYHVKHGNIAESNEENERTRWGKRLQEAIAEGVAYENAFVLRRMDEYIRDTDLRVGSSFDFGGEPYDEAGGIFGAGLVPGTGLKPEFIVEIKNVDSLAFKRGWIETDFGLEAPAHIELQLQHQLGVSGLREGYIAAFVGGNRVELLRREFDAVVWQRILDLAAWFWSLTDAPAPDYARDYEVISRLHGYSSAGKVIEATGEIETLMQEYKIASAEMSDADKRRKIAKAKALELIGDAERVEGLSYNLSAKMISDTEIAAYTRKGYRDFRVLERKS